MTLTNLLKDRVDIQVRISTRTSTGETIDWKPKETRYASVTPLEARAIAVYQQIDIIVSHRIVFRGNVLLSIGNNRFKWKDKTLEPTGPVENIKNTTIILAKEI